MFLHQNECFRGKLSSVYIQMSPAHPEIMAQTRIYQACLPRKKAIQQRMPGIFVQIKATRSIGSRVTVLPLETSGTQSGSDPQSGDSGQVQPGRTRNTAPSHHQCMHSTAVVGAPLGRPVFVSSRGLQDYPWSGLPFQAFLLLLLPEFLTRRSK